MWKKIIKTALYLVLGVCTAWLVRLINLRLSGGSSNAASVLGALAIGGFALLVVLSVVIGFLALAGRPIKKLAVTIAIIAVAAAGALAAGVAVTAPGEDGLPDAEATPRPIVTAPPVEIKEKEEPVNNNPETGTEFVRIYGDRSCKLTVENNSSSVDYYVKLRDGKGRKVLAFYVRAGESITIASPQGSYEILFASGRKWQDEEVLFGEKTVLQKGLETLKMPYFSSAEFIISGENASPITTIRQYEFEDTKK